MDSDSMLPNLAFSHPSSHSTFEVQSHMQGMIGNSGTFQYNTSTSGLVAPARRQFDLEWFQILQHCTELMDVMGPIDTKLRELQDLFHKQQDALAQLGLRAKIFLSTATIPYYVPFTTASPDSTNISAHPLSQTADPSTSQGGLRNDLPHMSISPTPTSVASYYAQVAGHDPPPQYMVRNRAGKEVFRCHGTLGQGAPKRYICHCGKRYTRRDSLLRHAAIHMSENLDRDI